MSAFDISYLLLWALQVAMAITLVALARQVGLLHLRIGPRGAGQSAEGPVLGTVVSEALRRTIRGQSVPLFEPGRHSLLLYVSPRCSLCEPVLDGARRLKQVEEGRLTVQIAVDDERGDGLAYARKHGFHDAFAIDQLGLTEPASRPFALLLDGGGEVLGSGIVNNLEQVEELIEGGKRLGHKSLIIAIPRSNDQAHLAPRETAPVGAAEGTVASDGGGTQ